MARRKKTAEPELVDVDTLDDEDEAESGTPDRDRELSKRKKIREELLKTFREVEKGFTNQAERADDILDCWDAYNCKLGDRQFYNGNSKLYLPIVRSAVNARKTRFVNQIFPKSGRNVEAVSAEPDPLHSLIALIEHYISDLKLRTQVLPALMVNGDVEGQYSIYVDWNEITRHTVVKDRRPVVVDDGEEGVEVPALGEVEDIVESKITDRMPTVEIIADSDLLVLPVNADSIEAALEKGGSVTVIRRWSKTEIEAKIDRGDFVRAAGEMLAEGFSKKEKSSRSDVQKKLASAAGIKTSEGAKYAQGYEVWKKIEVDGERRICRAFYGGNDIILGCKLNPFWCDRVPVISAPVEKMPGVFKGMSKILPGVLDLQVTANDAINEGMDSAAYALMPIIMTDPEKNPRVASMILDLAAVWEVDPNSTKFSEFPQLWKEAFSIVAAAKNEIFQALSVNPAMLPQQTGGKAKRNQAEVAMEQSIDVLSTSDAVINIEGGILTPLVQRVLEYDHQFRDDDLLVRSFGEMGLKVTMQEIEPIQMGKRLELRWYGVEAARNAAQIQQMIAGLNVIRGIPPSMYPGYRLNVAPLLVHLAMDTFGPRLAPLILEDVSAQLSVDPEVENQLIEQGFEVGVHVMDNDGEHMKAHLKLAASPARDAHLQRHQLSMSAKQAAVMKQAGQPGAPGGDGPGVPGSPAPGGQVANPRMMKQSPGAIHPDQMARAGAPQPPRK